MIGFGDPFQVVASIVTLARPISIWRRHCLEFRHQRWIRGSIEAVCKTKEDLLNHFGQSCGVVQSGIDKAYELEAYNQWVEVALKGLNQLDPSKYPLKGENERYSLDYQTG